MEYGLCDVERWDEKRKGILHSVANIEENRKKTSLLEGDLSFKK